MYQKLVTPPEYEPVSTRELKQQLRIETNDEDALLRRYISAAREYCEGLVNYKIGKQVWNIYFKEWKEDLSFNIAPVISLDSLTYFDVNGNEQAVSESDYFHAVLSVSSWIKFKSGFVYPALEPDMPLPITATVTVGSRQTIERQKHAIILMASDWYKNREDTTDVKLLPIPNGVKSLLNLNRVEYF